MNHRRAVLLVNLGSPESPDPRKVKAYLREFLMDPHVIDIPGVLRFMLVHGIILPQRPRKSAEAYQKIWRKEGSPLIFHSVGLWKSLQDLSPELPIRLAMRYGRPSLQEELEILSEQGIERLDLLPLYPHFAASSTGTVLEQTKKLNGRLKKPMSLHWHHPFYADPQYLQSLHDTLKPHLVAEPDHILFSYHGLPERHLMKADPTRSHCMKDPNCCEIPSPSHATCYRYQVFQTTQELARLAQLHPESYSTSFQSRLGRTPWLKPYTDFHIPELAEKGVKKLLVLCPSFVADCLETLEEIGIRAREDAANLGMELTLVPCLNEHPHWVQTLTQWVQDTSRFPPLA